MLGWSGAAASLDAGPMPLSEPPKVGLWQCVAVRAEGTPAWFAVVWSAHLPDDQRVELPEADALEVIGDRAMCIARYDDDNNVASLAVTPLLAPKAPPLWFAEIPEPDGAPPASSLVAFSGHDVDPGSLLDSEGLRTVTVRSSDQVAAIRWYPSTGEADQIYVAPDRRRQSIGTAIPLAASTLNLARGLPRLWGDGQRTAMGDRLAKASPYSHRFAELTHLAPPMTPFEPALVSGACARS